MEVDQDEHSQETQGTQGIQCYQSKQAADPALIGHKRSFNPIEDEKEDAFVSMQRPVKRQKM